VRFAGACASENAGMSNDNAGGKEQKARKKKAKEHKDIYISNEKKDSILHKSDTHTYRYIHI